jgi:sugar phosphate isomerase/epimerase
MSLRFGYGLNGFTDHRLEDALAVLADLGYDGVALTLDHAHLDPFARDVASRVRRVRALLDRHALDVVVETGARFLLDPRRKHEPTLVSEAGRERRVDLLHRAVRIAAELGAPVVSCWSGVAPVGVPTAELVRRVDDGIAQVVPVAEAHGVDLAVEPEPGMVVERVADVLDLRRRLGDPEQLRLTIDVGHLRCVEDDDPAAVVLGAGPHVANVQIDDMRRGVHEHLPFGEGEVDVPPVLAAFRAVGYRGLVSVELPRHPWAAPTLATQSLRFLRAAERAAGTLPTPLPTTRPDLQEVPS